ncbi:MAG: acyltransferase [Legionella sp.]|uniref:acyltransferase family protein n=1 Tax=Legionella sp. TaxID=459 RepID=UPI0028480689|nr:acyltransferase [Legionella sp.]
MEENRLSFLDGMRGWAALAVYLFHLIIPFRGKFAFTDFYFYQTPLQILLDGELGIFLFFLISGFSLSYKFFNTPMPTSNTYLKEAAQYRYFRLLIPIFFATLIPYFLTKFHLMYNINAYVGAYSKPFSFAEMVKYTFIELPFQLSADSGLFGPIYWTIYLEFTGSFLIFSFLALFGTWNLRFLLYPFILSYLYTLTGIQQLYFLFITGVLICDLFCSLKNNRSLSERSKPSVLKRTGAIAIACALIYLYYYCVVCKHPIFLSNSRFEFSILLFVIILTNTSIMHALSSKPSQFLGRISFALYLIHFPIFCSLLCFILNFLSQQGYSPINTALIATGLSSLVVFFVAYLFSLSVEEQILIKIKIALKKISNMKIQPQPKLISSNNLN